MNVAALLQETPSEDVSARRPRSGSTAAGNNPGQAGPPTPLSQPSPLDRERERERERDRDVWGRGRPPPPPSNAGLRSLVHSPVDPRSNPPDSYRTGPPPHIQSSPSSSILGRGQPPLSPAPSLKDSKIPANVSSSPSSSRASGPQAYGGPHGHPHSSHPSPAMGSLRPNAALASGASQTSVNSGIGGGEAATGWPGPGYGGPGRERRGSASSGIGVGGGLLRSNQPHPHHSSHSPVFDKEYHQQQPGARRKTISSGSGPLGGSATNSNIMPPPSQLVGPGTGTPPDDLPPLTHKSSSMAPPMSHPSALPPSMHGLPPPATHQHSMSSSSFMERERDILLNREPRDHPMDHLRPSSTPAGPPASNPIGTPRQFHAPPSAPTGPRGGPPTSYSQPGSGRVTPINDLERDRERDRIMYNREREHQHQRERTLSSASASAAIGPSPMTSPRGVQYGPPPPPGHHPSQSLPPPPNPGQAGSPLGSGRGPPQSPHIHPASGASHAPPANPYAAASSGFGHSPYGPPPSSASGHGPPHPPPSSAGPLPPTGPARDRERERDREFERERERTRFMDRDRDLRDREFQRDLREREQRDRELNRDRELRERELRERDREAAFREREIRERERDMREREDRDRERARDRDIIRDVRPDPRDMREARDIPGVPGGGRPDPRDPRELRPDPRDFRPDPRADPYRERDLRVDHRERERRDPRGREHEWERKEREKEDERIQWEKEQERERREREQREHREQANRERDLKEKEAREREARDKEREQIMIMREKQREKELRDRERLLRERERQETKRDGEGREGVSRNPTIIIGPGVPPPAPSSMQREAQRGSTSQPPPAAPSANPAGPHPPQSHHQGRFNTAFISNFAGPNERGSRNSSRVGSPNPATLGSQMSTINMSVGSAPTIGPGVPGPVSSSVGGMHIIPGGMLGGGIPSQMPSGANDPKGRVASAIPLDRRDRDGRDVADSKEGIRERERERERDRDRDREIKPAPMPTMPTPSNTRAPGVLPKEQPQPAIRDRERERERERELYAAAIAGGNSAIPPANSRRHGEGEHHGHSRHSSLSQQQQQQQQHQRERERERDRERETRRHQSGPYPHPYDEIPGPRERERERERINIVNAGQIPPSARDGDVEMGYGYPPPPHHSMGPPPPPGWNDGPAGPTSMEMGYPGAPPGSHHPMPHHPPPPSQSYAGYHPPPHGPYPVGPPLPGYGPSPPPGQPGYGQPHPQQYGYDDRGMAGPVDMNGIHHAPNGVVVPSGNGVIGHPMPPGPPLQQQQPHHPPQHVYSVPPGYMPMSTVTGLAHPGPQQGSGLLLPTSTLALAASSPLESPDGQLDMVRAAEAAALLQVEQEKEYERRPEVKAKTTINLGTFVYPDLPFPYNFDLGGGIASDTKVVVQENPEKKVTVVETKGRKRVGKEEKAVEGKAGSKENAAEEGEIAESAKSTKEKASSPVVKEEPTARTAKIPVIDLVSDDAPPKGPARESCTTLESNLDVATKVDDVEVDVETRVAVIVPHGHLPDKKPTKPRIWGGGISPAPHIGPNSKPGPSLNGRTNEPSSSRVPKMITRDSLIPLLPTPPRSSLDTLSGHGEEWRTYITQLEAVGRTILTKYAPRRIYTDDSDVALCAIHSGWVSWDGVSDAKRQGRDLRVEVKVMRVSRLGSDGQWSGREVGKLVEVQSYGKGGKGSAADRERREEVVTRFTGGLGERCWSAKGRNGWIEVGEASDTIDEDPLSDGRALMSAAWGTGHDGAAIEILSASFVERGTSRKAPGLGRRNRAQRMLEYAERRMTVLGQPPQQQHPLLRTIAKGNINPRFVSSLTASPWNFTTTILAGRKRRRGYGCVNTHPPINAKLPNSTLLEAINELDERERDKGGRGAKRQRTGSLSEVVHLPGKTQEEWREDTLMNLKTVVFATNTVPPPVTAEDSYPTSPTSPAGQNPITAGLLTAGGSSKKDSTIADSVRVGYKYDRIVLKQILFPSDPLPPASNSLKTSPAIDKEKALLSHFLGTLPRRQVILETATKERYLLAPRRADGSFGLIVPDARKVRWAYDISLILEQEVIVEEAKDDLSANVVGELPVDVLTSPDEAQALTTTAEVPQVVEPVQDSPKTASEVKADAPAAVEEKEEGELESNDPAEERLKTPEPPPTIQDKDGDVEMGDGDKEPGELNEDEEKPKTSEVQPEVPQVPVVLVPSPSLVASPHPPVLKLDTINLTPSRAPSRVHSKMNSPVNPQSSVAPSAVGPDVPMDAGDEEVEEESFVTLIRGEDEDGNEQSVHYPVQMLQRHVTEGMLRFEKEGIYVKEAAFVGPTVPPSPSTSVPDEADGERMDVVEQGPGGQPTEWRMQVVSWKWAGQAWGDY